MKTKTYKLKGKSGELGYGQPKWVHERGDVWTVYFLHGATISMECLGLWLSPGWISKTNQRRMT